MRATEAMGGADVTLPLAIMTSGDTHARTEALLRENDYFGMAAAQARRSTPAPVLAWPLPAPCGCAGACWHIRREGGHSLVTLKGKEGYPL